MKTMNPFSHRLLHPVLILAPCLTVSAAGPTPADLSPYSFSIEAEQFDYDGGQSVPAVSTMPYAGDEYAGLGAVYQVDYQRPASGNDAYRTGEDPNVPLIESLAPRWGKERPGFNLTSNYRMGWIGNGDWFNYSRDIPAGFYRSYAALSINNSSPGTMFGWLSVVTEGGGTTEQTLQDLGGYVGPGSGGWAQNDLVPLLDAEGRPTIFELPGGPTTLRFTTGAGDYDWFTLEPVGAAVIAVSPPSGSTAPRNTSLSFTIQNYTGAINLESIRLEFDGVDVTGDLSVAATAGGATVDYDPGLLEKETLYAYVLSFEDDSDPVLIERFAGTFTTSPLGPGIYVIEVEDFDFEGGNHRVEADVMPYTGGAYEGLGAVADVDYHSNSGTYSDVYRAGETPNVNLGLYSEIGDRGAWQVDPNYVLGWYTEGSWQNYTRDIPPGVYELFASMSQESTGASTRISHLDLVISGEGTTAQSTARLGSFNGAGTGNWSTYSLIPLADSGGNRVAVSLGGVQTLRWTQQIGNLDCLVLFPVGEFPAPADALVRIGAEDVRPFRLNDVYQAEPMGDQIAEQTVASGTPAVFQVKLENDGESPRVLTARVEESAETGWVVQYAVEVEGSAVDISEALRTLVGYQTPELPPGGSQIVTVSMTPMPAALGGTRKQADLILFPGTNVVPASDAVRMVARVALEIQPDLMIANEGDWNYAGERIFNADAIAQARYQEVAPAGAAVYRVLLENHGNAASAFLLEADPAAAGWTARVVVENRLLLLDGNRGRVELGGWGPGTQWTTEAWVRASTLPTGRRTIAGGAGGAVDWGITMQEGRFGVLTKPPGDVTITYVADAAVEPGRWYHVAGTCDGAEAWLYVDGVLAASGPVQPNYSGYANAQIGSEACCGGNSFPGWIKDVRIWDRPLDPAEIQAGMGSLPSSDAPGLLGHWLLDEGSGGTALDRSDNARHGTLRDGATWQSHLDFEDGRDITAAVAGQGWQTPVLGPGQMMPVLIQLQAQAALPAGSTGSALLGATSIETQEIDAVRAVAMVAAPVAQPGPRTYTLTEEFELGRMIGVEARTVLDQLQLEIGDTALPIIWVPNSTESTVSLVDTRTGRELGRYRTGPNGRNGDPSRTTVDLLGNCWVGNRTSGTAVKIGLRFTGQFVDRNGNGIIETSWDVNGDGDITGAELLDWGLDECVLFEVSVLPGQEGLFIPGQGAPDYADDLTYRVNLREPVSRGLFESTHIPGDPSTPYANNHWNPGPRSLAVDTRNNLWLGSHDSMRIYYIDGGTGQILRKLDLSSVGHTAYGAVIDRDGIVWSSGQDRNHVLRLDPGDNSFTTIPIPHFTYGLGLSTGGKLYVSGWDNSKLSRVDLATQTLDWTVEGRHQSRGVAQTDDGDVWTADSGPGTVTRWTADGVIRNIIPVGNQPTGVAVDQAGKVWVVNYGDENIHRINPTTDAIDLSKRLIGGRHYGYSDMTGRIVRNATTRLGIWTLLHNSGFRNTPWGRLTWTVQEPGGTAVKIRVRSSNDRVTWSSWEVAFNDLPLRGVPPGRYLEIEAQLQSFVADVTPILEALTVIPAADVNLGDLIYDNDFTAGADEAWSSDLVTPSPAGDNNLLGTFGNETLTFTQTGLPPHTAVALECDLVVAGPWVGNDTVGGPSLFEADLAGGLSLIRTTFHNGSPDSPAPGQAYPDNLPDGQHPPRTDAVANNTLGFPGGDATYRLLFVFPHTADTLVVNFTGSGLITTGGGGARVSLAGVLPRNADPSLWGLDNVAAYVTRESVPLTLAPLGLNGLGQFQLELYGEVQATYTLQASENLIDWTPLETRKLLANPLLLTDPTLPLSSYRFYRAVSEE